MSLFGHDARISPLLSPPEVVLGGLLSFAANRLPSFSSRRAVNLSHGESVSGGGEGGVWASSRRT
jgi:hypothetical protein